MTFSASRRALFRQSTALGLASAGLPAGIALAQGKSVSATTYPGAWESAHRGILLPAFSRATGASTNLVASLAVDTVSKIVAAQIGRAHV